MLADQGGGRRRGGVLAATLVAIACTLLLPSIAAAELLEVNSVGDEADAMPGLGGCLTAGGKCTLRAAIEEANGASEEEDEITFDEAFDGQEASTITLDSGLPAIVRPLRINGRECITAAGVAGPCVGIDGSGAGVALAVDGAEGVEIEGLAVTGAQIGIELEGSPRFKVRASWLGVKLDGSAGGDTTGVLVGPGSDSGRVGGEGPDAGNVFGYSAEDGLHVHGVAGVRVLGNYFGVEKDGATATNGKDIEVTSVAPAGPEAVGTAIGTRVSSTAVVSPACDGGCNVISGAVTDGLDLQGDGGGEAPAIATTVAGNYVGLEPSGTATIPDGSAGVDVGEAPQTLIGGLKSGEANRIGGGATGVRAGPAAQDLVVSGNSIGVGADGAQLVPPDDGIVIDSQGLTTRAVEAEVVGNRIRMDGGTGIDQLGFGARLSDNQIAGAEVGIGVRESDGEDGNLIEGNSVEGAGASGILVENDFNEIVGNEVLGAGGAGIAIQGPTPSGASGNLIGGDAASAENSVTGSGDDAISITDQDGTENEVARNHGIVNGGLFIDLVASTVNGEGPNGGVGPPALTSLTPAGAGGSGAEPGAKVRLFRKRTAEAGELESFLGEATVDPEGNWQVGYSEAVPAGTIVAATQTNEEGGTSELAAAATPAAGTGSGSGSGIAGGGGGGGGGGGSVDRVAPRTKIVKAAKRRSAVGVARFAFDSDELGSTFECKLDRRPFQPCRSPKAYRGLSVGRHVFEVRAVDGAGNADASPAKREFTVVGKAGR